jgi:hypothetical protein
MNSLNTHPKLIQANIALSKGSRVEARRLLDEYFNEGGRENDSLVMWLDAQTQTNREERIQRLNALINSVEPENQYSQLARRYLHEEARYREILNPEGEQPQRERTLLDVPMWKALIFMVAGSVMTLLVVGLFNVSRPAATEDVSPTQVAQAPTPINLPDRSRALVADSYTARYTRGILQITAIEDESERVIASRSQALIAPVPGARFYALSVVFECRYGVCNEPPEAQVQLRLDNGNLITPREEVSIAGERILQPIALGRTTAGWLVFEIPLVTQADALVISSISRDDEFEPVEIKLVTP